MSGETYHFSFDTIGVGKNYFESSASYQNITQKNGVALTSEMDGNTLSVRDETSITSGVALFAKRNAGALPNGESGSYDQMCIRDRATVATTSPVNRRCRSMTGRWSGTPVFQAGAFL